MDVWTIADDGVSVTGKEVIVDGQTTRLSLPNLTGQWTPEVVQDWNGDGKADVLWRDNRSNILYSWRMDGNIVREGPEVKDATVSNQTTPPPSTTLSSNFITTGLSYGAYRTTNVVQVKSINVPQVTAGTTRLSAFNIGVLEGKGSFNDFVGGAGNINKSDWYTFTVETPSFLTALVSSSTSPNASNTALKADVYLEGTDPNTPIANVTGIDSVLAKGKYYIKVSHSDPATSNTATPYTLTFTGKVGITNLNAAGSATDGFGLALSKNSIALDALEANNPIDVTSFKFVNDGDFAANDVEVGFYVSKNGTFEAASDKRITLTSTTSGQTIANNLLLRSSVARGATVTLSGLRLSLPGKNDPFWDASANYSIIAVIDPRGSLVAEKKKDDNTQAASLATIGVGNADLLGTAFTVAGNIQSTTTTSSTINGTFAINNKGSRSTGVNGQSVKVKFYISSNDAIGSSDYLAFEKIIPATTGIASGATFTDTYSFTLPKLSASDSTTPTSWDFYWDSLTASKTGSFTAYVGMVIEFVDDADSANNSNVGLGKDKGTATVVPR